jgi:hypothetical protein
MDDLDLLADLNAQDDDGFGWPTLAAAAAPDRVRPVIPRGASPAASTESSPRELLTWFFASIWPGRSAR